MTNAAIEWHRRPPASIAGRVVHGVGAIAQDIAGIMPAKIWMFRARWGI